MSACTTLQPAEEVPPLTMVQSAPQATNDDVEAVPAVPAAPQQSMPALPPTLPNVALSDDVLQKVMTAEIATQRGDWKAAYVTLLSLAQQTRDPRLARRAAEVAMSAKQAGEALSAVRLWRKLDPASMEASQFYLGFMLINHHFSEIQKTFSELLNNAQPEQRGTLLLQAQRLLANARDKEAAFTTLTQIIAPYKTMVEAHLALAQAAYVKGDKQLAIAEAHLALIDKPDSQLAALTIAQSSSPEEAAKALLTFLSTNPKARDVRLAYASMLIDAKQYEQASKQFEQLLRDKPDDINPIYTLAILALNNKQPKLAEKYFNDYLSAYQAHPTEENNVARTYLNLAQLAEERKDDAAAKAWLEKVDPSDEKEKDKDNSLWVDAQVRLASMLAKEGKLEQARAFLHDVKINNANEQVQLIQAEAQLLREAKQLKEASNVIQQGIINFPDNADLLYDFGMLAETQNDTDGMESAFRRVIELAPDNPNAYNALGYSLADRNIKLDEAQSLIENAVKLSGNDPYILDSLGWVKFRLSKLDEAEQILRRAFAMRNDVEIAAHLGEVLWTRGKTAEAQQIWHEAALKDTQNATLKSTMERFSVKP